MHEFLQYNIIGKILNKGWEGMGDCFWKRTWFEVKPRRLGRRSYPEFEPEGTRRNDSEQNHLYNLVIKKFLVYVLVLVYICRILYKDIHLNLISSPV